MSNKNQFPMHEPIPRFLPIDIHSETLGRTTTHSSEQAALHRIKEGQALDDYEIALDLEANKDDPATQGRVRNLIGRLRGTTLSPKETEFIAKAKSSFELYDDYDYVSLHEQSQSRDLDEVRRLLGNASPDQAIIVDQYLTGRVPPFLQAVKDEEAEESTWVEWLCRSDNEQLTNFLQWHVDTINSQQSDPNFQAEIQRRRSLYSQGIKKGVQDGWLSERSLESLDTINDSDVYVGDIFGTILKGNQGYHDVRTQEIVIPNWAPGKGKIGEADILRCLDLAFYHEENHAVIQNIEQEIFNIQWLSEALTEHIGLALKHGSIDVVSPAERTDEDHRYVHERILLDTLLNKGKKKVDPRLATKAYSGSLEEQIQFIEAIDEAWLPDVLYVVSFLAVKLTEQLSNDEQALAAWNEATDMEIELSPKDMALHVATLMLVSSKGKLKLDNEYQDESRVEPTTI